MNGNMFAPVFNENQLNQLNQTNNEKEIELIYRCRNCNGNLASDNPASQYQRQKLIQKTVRVASSLYTMNLGSLTTYKAPLKTFQLLNYGDNAFVYVPPGVNWNQMSDKPMPSNQVVRTGSIGASSTRHTIVRNRPGAMSPGGIGVDIKHNSYDRYLNRIKGKGPLRRGKIPATYGVPIEFNNAYPIYGGKTIKTAIINNCVCPQEDKGVQNKYVFDSVMNNIQANIYSVSNEYNVGDYVWARKVANNNVLYKGVIVSITDGIASVLFADDTVVEIPLYQLTLYYHKEYDVSTDPVVEEVECTLNF